MLGAWLAIRYKVTATIVSVIFDTASTRSVADAEVAQTEATSLNVFMWALSRARG